MSDIVYTIGHSSHSAERFLALLARHEVTAVADVRSSPYSRFAPQFNREVISVVLSRGGIEYVFLGEELGARSADRTCYVDGRVRYDLLARTAVFQRGLDRVQQMGRSQRIALMCAEKDPLTCHRAILVARHLVARGMIVRHILEDGTLEEHDRAMDRLLREMGLPDHDLFRTREEMAEEACRRREAEIAYRESSHADQSVPAGATP
jgi:uncharacterized protein (DUF488 family)